MATPAEQANLYNEAVAQGLSQQEAIDFAGIQDFNNFVFVDGELTSRVPPSAFILDPNDVSDTGGVPTQSLADIDGDTGFVPQSAPEVIQPGFSPYGEQDDPFDPDLATEPGQDEFQNELDNLRLAQEREERDFIASQQSDTGAQEPPPVSTDDPQAFPNGPAFDDDGNLQPGFTLDADGNAVFIGDGFIDPGLQASAAASRKEAALTRARAQATLNAQQGQADQGDWRVKLRLAPGATYLYEAPEPGILAPLSTRSGTGGVVFPYMPTITTSYNARYSNYDLTHSNYRGYFYSGSHVEAVTLTGTFTAQDSVEAAYLLAVIHFFRSVTKMFYGQDDAFAGTPPPLVYLQGLGQYQFSLHPCAVQQFNYNLPADVDYIRANSPNINGTNLLARRTRGPGVPTNPFSSAWSRIQNTLNPQGVTKGAVPLGGQTQVPVLGTDRPTYVPTRMEITLSLLPMQSREQVSRVFNLKAYANGNLLRGGTNQPGAFW